jgi:hypothetical protein
MEQWPCRLVAQEDDVSPVVDAITVIQNAPKGPAGTFSISGSQEPEVVITYNPAEVTRPQSLVATFAHELAHYLGKMAKCPPPGGEKNWEYATDVLAVFTGFGIFLANSAVEFQQFTSYDSQGWASRTLGYLSEFELVYCLALFCVLKDIPKDEVMPHLKRSLVAVYEDCLENLREKAAVVAELASTRSTATPTKSN